MSDLYDAIAGVHDAASFRAFVLRLRDEAERNAEFNGPFMSENYNIGDILEAAEGWATTDIAEREFATANPWAAAARILLVGHYHE